MGISRRDEVVVHQQTNRLMDDRRHHPRVDSENVSAEVLIGGLVRRFAIANLSEGGALIEGHIDMALESTVAMGILLPNAAVPVITEARVVRHSGGGGARFTAVAFPDAPEEIRRWIADIVLGALHAAFPA